jgi:phenylpropionate dioxygenase-like ring-hydroxylating dioxygenase large terminal subunit
MIAGAASIRTLVTEELSESDTEVSMAVTLPASCYTDPSFFTFEQDVLFMREWICLGRAEQIPAPGDYFTLTVADEPLIVVRGDDLQVRVLSAVCRHRSMVITDPVPKPRDSWWNTAPCEKSGNCGRVFRCPYHYWSYDLAGQLVAAPDMHRTANFDKAKVSLPHLKVELWNNFIFANFDQTAPDLSPRLAEIDAMIKNWQISEMVCGDHEVLRDLPWNWKVMIENFVEFYHSDRLHNPICQFSKSASYIPHEFDPAGATIISAGKTTHPDFGFNPTFKALFPPISTLTDEQRQLAVFFLIPPSLAFGVNSDSAFYFLLNPRSCDRLDITVAGLYPREYLDMPVFHQLETLAGAGIEFFNEQDFAAVSSVQRGLRSRFSPRGRLSWQEEPISHVNRWLIRRYRTAVDRTV